MQNPNSNARHLTNAVWALSERPGLHIDSPDARGLVCYFQGLLRGYDIGQDPMQMMLQRFLVFIGEDAFGKSSEALERAILGEAPAKRLYELFSKFAEAELEVDTSSIPMHVECSFGQE